jgi:pimeloyl-ACP methyl ester carboxylesterase
MSLLDSFISNEPISQKWKNKILKIDDAGHFIELDQPAALACLIKMFAEDCFQ